MAQQRPRTEVRGKYQPLYTHLCNLRTGEWQTTFGEIEAILGSALPPSARLYDWWWANEGASGHVQARAWDVAGWETAKVDLQGETLLFRRLP